MKGRPILSKKQSRLVPVLQYDEIYLIISEGALLDSI